MIASFAYFSAGALIFSGQTLIDILYDYRYSEAGAMLQILAVALLTIPSRLATECFTALGMPRLLSNIIATRMVALFVLMPAGLHFFDLHGALWGIVLSSFCTIPFIVFYMVKHRLFDWRMELILLPAIPIGMGAGKVFNLMLGY